MKLSDLKLKPSDSREKCEFEYDGETITVWVEKPAFERVIKSSMLDGGVDLGIIANCVFEHEDSKRPFFTEEALGSVPSAFGVALITAVARVNDMSGEKKS